jgi:hypothetical protein
MQRDIQLFGPLVCRSFHGIAYFPPACLCRRNIPSGAVVDVVVVLGGSNHVLASRGLIFQPFDAGFFIVGEGVADEGTWG